MVRRLPLALATFSLLLALATAVLSVRSYHYLTAVIVLRTADRVYGVSVVRGGALVAVVRQPETRRFVNIPIDNEFQMVEPNRQVVGFAHYSYPGGLAAIRVPLWFLTALACLPALTVLARNRRESARAARGLCPRCGYDLRATPGRCPECGADPLPPPPRPSGRANNSGV